MRRRLIYLGGNEKKPEELGSAQTRVRSPGDYHIQLANIDAQLTLWVNQDLPFGEGKKYDPPEIRNKGEQNLDRITLAKRRAPSANDLEPASLGSLGAQVKVQHLRLWRDTYYTQDQNNADFHIADWAEPQKMEVPPDPRVVTMYVQPGHYLCLGDNSPASSDSRDWGAVPKRLLLGRAMLVYFPFKRAGPIR